MSGKKITMPEDKAKRIAVGATVAGVLLVIFLAIVIIVQCVSIGVKNAQSRRLSRSIEEYTQRIEEGERDLEFYESDHGRYFLALERGWRSADK